MINPYEDWMAFRSDLEKLGAVKKKTVITKMKDRVRAQYVKALLREYKHYAPIIQNFERKGDYRTVEMYQKQIEQKVKRQFPSWV